MLIRYAAENDVIRRQWFGVAVASSLLLCVAVGVLWAQGDLWLMRLHYNSSSRADEGRTLYFDASSYAGTLILTVGNRHFGPAYFASVSSDALHPERFSKQNPPGLHGEVVSGRDHPKWSMPPARWRRPTHYVDTSWIGYRDDSLVWSIPHWLATALLLVLPALWLNRLRKARRARKLGLCSACGYDLRETPERCPECGTVQCAKAAA